MGCQLTLSQIQSYTVLPHMQQIGVLLLTTHVPLGLAECEAELILHCYTNLILKREE